MCVCVFSNQIVRDVGPTLDRQDVRRHRGQDVRLTHQNSGLIFTPFISAVTSAAGQDWSILVRTGQYWSGLVSTGQPVKNRCRENALFKQTAFEQLRLPIVPSKNAVVVITVRRQSFGLRHSRRSKSTPLRLQLQDRLLSWSGVWSRLWPRLNWSSQPGRFTVIYSRPLGFLRQYFTFIVCLCCCSTGFSPQSGSDT